MTDAPDRIWAVADVNISAQITDVYAQDNPDGFVDKPTEYTRTDISQARIAELEAALSDISQMHGDNPSTAMADMPDADYQRYIFSQARNAARAALKDKP